jgi:3-oxoadipate enol-lactonase
LKVLSEIESAHVEHDGIKIAYWDVGEGIPILLIIGLGTPAESWNVLPSILAAQGYRAVVVDNRDCGRSSPCEGIDYDIVDMAEDAIAVLDHLEITSAHVVGISMGGMIAQELVVNHPERVDKLVLMATMPGRPAAVSANAEVLGSLFSRQTGDQVTDLAFTLGRLMGPGFAERNQELVRTLAETRLEVGSDAAAFSRQWQAILRFGAWDRLHEVKAPTLVIHGKEDPLVPFPNGELIASRIPGAELLALDGVGHFVPLEAPQETFQAVLRFLPAKTPEARLRRADTPRGPDFGERAGVDANSS